MPRLRLALCAVVLVAVALRRASADWPTLHRDYQRSGYTSQPLKRPVERKWFRSFVEEMIGPRCEAIVAEKLCFIGTYAGNLHALDVATGTTAWQAKIGGPIGHAPCYHDGRIYVCSDDGAQRGSLVCLRASDGRVLWRYEAKAGIWNSPACDGRNVYVGDRAGVFHAVDAKTGEKAWTFATGAMILKPASFSSDNQRIIVGSEDMHVYCLSPDGKLLWKSAKLAGLSQRDAAPTIWDGMVIVRTNPTTAFHSALYEGRRLVTDIQRQLPRDSADVAYEQRQSNQYLMRRTDRREKAEHEGIVKSLREKPHLRTWFTFNLADGREPWITSVLYTSGLHNPPSPPTFNPASGELYTTIVTALSPYCDGVSQVPIGIGCVDARTGYVSNLPHAAGDRVPGYWAGMTMIADETSALSLMSDYLLVTHQGALGGVDLKNRELGPTIGMRDSYGGLFGPGVHGGWDGAKKLAAEGYIENTVNEWHGPDRSIVAISDDRMFWVVGSCVVCLGGPDVAAADSGGSKPSAPWKWSKPRQLDGGNVVSALGTFDESVPKKVLDVAAVERYLAEPPVRKKRLPAELQQRLDAAIVELINDTWHCWIVQLGISGNEYHFNGTGETMLAVAAALPYLSPAVRTKAVAYLDTLFAEGAPFKKRFFSRANLRREHYDMPVYDVPRGAPHAPYGDAYALWAYAYYADRWQAVVAQTDLLQSDFNTIVKKAPTLTPHAFVRDAGERLNGPLGDAIADVRIMRHADKHDEARRAAELVAFWATERVHCEKAEQRLVSRREHHATLPRYEYLTPEIGQLLADHAGEALRTNLEDLNRELPVWYQAWGERLIGGENYINPPGLARGLFLARAYGLGESADTLVRYLDQPWCKADLYYIEKLTALARNAK